MPGIVAQHVDLYPYRFEGAEPRYLLMRRAERRLYAGEWRMVAGKIDEGEQAWQAAVRELWEETALHPRLLWAVPSLNRFYEWQTDRIQLVAAFAAEVAGEPELNPEHDRAEWMTASAAADRLCWPEQSRLLLLVDHLLRTGRSDALTIPV